MNLAGASVFLVVATIAALGLLTVVLPLKPTTRMALVTVLVLVPGFDPPREVGVASRVLAALIVSGAFVRASNQVRVASRSWSRAVIVFFFTFILIALLQVLAFRASQDSPNVFELGTDLASVGVGALTFAGAARLSQAGSTARPLVGVLGASLALSFLLGLALPTSSIVAQRLTGVFDNANTLGFVALMVCAMLVLLDWRPAIRLAGICLVVVCLIWTGSRTSAILALVLLLAGVVLQRSSNKRSWTWAFLLALGLCALVLLKDNSWVDTLFRDTQSRQGWTWAVEMLQAHPWSGVGKVDVVVYETIVRSVETHVASSPLTAAVWAGIPGVIVVLAIYVCLLTASAHIGIRTTVLTVVAIAHSVLESWLVVGSGTLIMLFALVWSACASYETQSKRGDLPLDGNSGGASKNAIGWLSN